MDYSQISKGSGYVYVTDSDKQIYIQYGIKKTVRYVKCAVENCTGRAKICNGKLNIQKPHTEHDDQHVEIGVLVVENQCKKRAATTTVESLRQIFDDETRVISAEVSNNVTFATLQNAMYKRRRLHLPSLPATADDADAHIEGTRFATLNGSVFFRGKVEAAGGTAVIFASDQQLAMLVSTKRVYVDATFKTVPSLYYQLFTVFINIGQHTFPVFYALMTRKTGELYKAVVEKLHSLVPACVPDNVMADFEEASVAAFKSVFGQGVSVSGCWFHFAQAVMKFAKKIGLSDAYKNDINTRRCVRALTCLPLLPSDDIAG
jgi:hypothetical protein